VLSEKAYERALAIFSGNAPDLAETGEEAADEAVDETAAEVADETTDLAE